VIAGTPDQNVNAISRAAGNIDRAAEVVERQGLAAPESTRWLCDGVHLSVYLIQYGQRGAHRSHSRAGSFGRGRGRPGKD
jgi:hypothetical protein